MINKIKPWVASIILLPIIIWLLINNGKFIFVLDHFNLLIHEGGHGIFRIFGKFIYTLGGSLMQTLIPCLFIFYSYTNKKIFSTQTSFIFLGQNLLNVSRYAADAKTQALPLLGGNKVYHDWNYLLNQLGIINYDYIVGFFFIALAVVSFLVGLGVPIFMNNDKEVKLNLGL